MGAVRAILLAQDWDFHHLPLKETPSPRWSSRLLIAMMSPSLHLVTSLPWQNPLQLPQVIFFIPIHID